MRRRYCSVHGVVALGERIAAGLDPTRVPSRVLTLAEMLPDKRDAVMDAAVPPRRSARLAVIRRLAAMRRRKGETPL